MLLKETIRVAPPAGCHWMAPHAAGLLLLNVLSSFVPSEGRDPFTVTVPQDNYTVEEHSNVTLLVQYSVSPTSTPHSLYIDLRRDKLRSIYRYYGEVEAPPFIHPLYKERLHCHLQLASTGKVSVVISDLKLDDTGRYTIVLVDGDRSNSTHFQLQVTPVCRPPEDEKPASRGRIGVYASLTLCLVAFVTLRVAFSLKQKIPLCHNTI